MHAEHAELASGAAQGSQAGVQGQSHRAEAAPQLILIQETCLCSITKTSGQKKHGQEAHIEGACRRNMWKHVGEALGGSLHKRHSKTYPGFRPGITVY